MAIIEEYIITHDHDILYNHYVQRQAHDSRKKEGKWTLRKHRLQTEGKRVIRRL